MKFVLEKCFFREPISNSEIVETETQMRYTCPNDSFLRSRNVGIKNCDIVEKLEIFPKEEREKCRFKGCDG